MKKIFEILSIIVISFLAFSSCEEPDDPALPYNQANSRVIGRTITSFDIFWEESTSDIFDRYEIYYKEYFTQDYRLYITISNQRQIYTTISGLIPNTEYKILIKTIDKNGNVWTSKELVNQTFNDVPSGFEKFEVTDFTYDRVDLEWSIYKDSYAVPFDRYEIHKGLKADFICNDSTLCEIIPTMETNKRSIADLKDKVGYYFKIRVYNKIGKFTESFVIYIHTPNAPPKSIVLYDPEEITETSAILKWQKSTDLEFEKYDIHQGNNKDFQPSKSNLIASIKDQKLTSFTLNGLKPKGDYVYKILVYDVYGDYSTSNYTGFTATLGGLPVPSELVAYDIGPGSIMLEWTPSKSTIFAKYTIYMAKDSIKLTNKDQVVFSGQNTDSVIRNLDNHTTYYLQIEVTNIFGKSALSKIYSFEMP
jgi:hypothetical protein